MVDTIPPTITVISPENKTYNTSYFWANISLDEPGDVALYSFDEQANQSLTKLNSTYFYKKISSTRGSHKIVFYVNDTSGNMNSSDPIYFYLNVTGFTTIELNKKKVWWNESVKAYGRAKDPYGNPISDALVNLVVESRKCVNYTDSSGYWECNFYSPLAIGNYEVKVSIAGIVNSTYLKVSPHFGILPAQKEERIVYEIPITIQDKNGKIKTVWVRITVYD